MNMDKTILIVIIPSIAVLFLNYLYALVGS